MFGAAKAPVIPPPPTHPFYPIGLDVVGYLANTKNAVELLSLFLGGWVAILAATWWGATKYSPYMKKLDKVVLLWFILTGTIHFFFEGYFAINHTRMALSQDFFGQLWKEYALSDSRYLTSDPFVLCMETVTAALWGPLSFLTAYYITVQHPLRFPVQAVVSLGQLYGLVLYYATGMFNHYYKNVTYCRPEAYYFWFYFFFMNFIWMVIPGLLLFQSMRMTGKAFNALDRINKSLQGNGSLRKPQANGHAKKHA